MNETNLNATLSRARHPAWLPILSKFGGMVATSSLDTDVNQIQYL